MTLRVNGEKIRDDEIKTEANRLKPHYDQYIREHNGDAGEKQLYEWSKENIIERTLLKQEALKDTQPIPPEDVEKTAKKSGVSLKGIGKGKLKAQIQLQIKTERLLTKITEKADKPSEKEIGKYYKDHKDEFSMPEQVHVRHIEKKDHSENGKTTAYVEMLNIKERLKKGESFEKLAGECSECLNTDLGYFPRGQMVPEFEEIVFNMNPGDVSDVFHTDFGYHIAKVYDKRPPAIIPLKDVRGRIAELLAEGKRNKAVEDFLDDLKAKAKIEDSSKS